MDDALREALENANVSVWYHRRMDHDVIWYAHYLGNPLDTGIPVPWERHEKAMANDGCTCPPEAYHSRTCPAFPIYASVSRDLGGLGYQWPLDYFKSQHLRWICSTEDTDEDGGLDWHVGGEINGPDHWCERQKKWVDLSLTM